MYVFRALWRPLCLITLAGVGSAHAVKPKKNNKAQPEAKAPEWATTAPKGCAVGEGSGFDMRMAEMMATSDANSKLVVFVASEKMRLSTSQTGHEDASTASVTTVSTTDDGSQSSVTVSSHSSATITSFKAEMKWDGERMYILTCLDPFRTFASTVPEGSDASTWEQYVEQIRLTFGPLLEAHGDRMGEFLPPVASSPPEEAK